MASNDHLKESAGRAAAQLVQAGSVVGLGTGSTANWFIISLGERVKLGLDIKAVPTSIASKLLAEKYQIPVMKLNDATHIDLCVDGADELTSQLQAIKGGGGSLLQEKMVASSSDQYILIADESKLVPVLGDYPLGVEVEPYGWKQTAVKLIDTGCKEVNLRKVDGKTFVTEHGHFILDCHYEKIEYPATLHSKLNNIPGVVENGLFLNMADAAIVAYADGSIKEFRRSL